MSAEEATFERFKEFLLAYGHKDIVLMYAGKHHPSISTKDYNMLQPGIGMEGLVKTFPVGKKIGECTL